MKLTAEGQGYVDGIVFRFANAQIQELFRTNASVRAAWYAQAEESAENDANGTAVLEIRPHESADGQLHDRSIPAYMFEDDAHA